MKSSTLFPISIVLVALPFLIGEAGLSSKGGAGCSAGIRSSSSSSPDTPGEPSGTNTETPAEASAASIKIQPEELMTIPPDGDQFYAELKGTTDEEVTWEIVDGNSDNAAALKERESKASHHALLRGKDQQGKLVRLTPLPEAEHLEWFTLKACSVEKPDLCDTKAVQLMKDDGLSCLNGVVQPGDSGTGLTCEARDAAGALKTGHWSQEMNAVFGRPVDDSCNAECPGSSHRVPWTLAIHHCGSFFPECKDYGFSFLKDEWKSVVQYLRVVRNPNDPDGCPGEKTPPPCWRTCDGSCIPFDVPVKGVDTILAEAEGLLSDYLKETCAVKLDLDVGLMEALRQAIEKSSYRELAQCTEGTLLAATQVIPWIEAIGDAGVIRDENGAPYTLDTIYRCTRRVLMDNSNGTKVPPPPPSDPSLQGAEAPGTRTPSDSNVIIRQPPKR